MIGKSSGIVLENIIGILNLLQEFRILCVGGCRRRRRRRDLVRMESLGKTPITFGYLSGCSIRSHMKNVIKFGVVGWVGQVKFLNFQHGGSNGRC